MAKAIFSRTFYDTDANGYVPGETAESFRRAHPDTLRFIEANARMPQRRNLAADELRRRGL